MIVTVECSCGKTASMGWMAIYNTCVDCVISNKKEESA